MSNQIVSKSAEASNIKQFDIAGNSGGKSVSIAGGIIKFEYFESILEDTITAKVTFADTGNTINNKTALDGLPIVGSEKVSIKFADNNKKELKLSLYIRKVTPVYDDTTKSMVNLDLASKEMIMNDKVRLNQRFDGKVSDYIKTIFTDKNYLGSEKNFEIEEVSNNYNFIGNNWKPFYARVLADWEKIMLFCDGDNAGKEMAKTITRELDNVFPIFMPENCDVNDVYLAEGAEGLHKRAGV